MTVKIRIQVTSRKSIGDLKIKLMEFISVTWPIPTFLDMYTIKASVRGELVMLKEI